MLSAYTYSFYDVGASVHPLADLRPDMKFREDLGLINKFADVTFLADWFRVNGFCSKYLPSSAASIKEVGNFINEHYFPEKQPGLETTQGMPETVSESDAYWLREHIREFETILQDELSKLPIFCCDDENVGNFAITKLLKGASNGYPDKTRKHLTSLCLGEIDEAGKCLVYERSTAAGFHMLRSVELTIRQYLSLAPGFTMPPLNRQNWGEYLKLLKDNGASRDVTDHLHNIKDNYRNPLMHPEDSLEIDEAVSLFGLAQSMNEMLVTDMKKRGFVT